jgi:deoxyribodipyrimidine photolyase-related protein
LNIGLLHPNELVSMAIAIGTEQQLGMNNIEGFVRQVMGWREYIRAVYQIQGVSARKRHFWNHHRPLPKQFWQGQTGIEPIDQMVLGLKETAYAHHIERLMVAGNFMLLCEIDPDDVYRWFMELFIDAYDWVMVPNVYGMSQFADGGMMSTKPYISGSNYLLKMSNFEKGAWCPIWDGLYWRFIQKHRAFFLKNPRSAMMVRQWDKMDSEKQRQHLVLAEGFLKKLDQWLEH